MEFQIQLLRCFHHVIFLGLLFHRELYALFGRPQHALVAPVDYGAVAHPATSQLRISDYNSVFKLWLTVSI